MEVSTAGGDAVERGRITGTLTWSLNVPEKALRSECTALSEPVDVFSDGENLFFPHNQEGPSQNHYLTCLYFYFCFFYKG